MAAHKKDKEDMKEPEEEEAQEEELQEENTSEDEMEDEVKQASNTPLFVMIFIIGAIIVGFFIAGSLAGDGTDEGPEISYKKYNGFNMINISGMWYTQIQLPDSENVHDIEMRNSPWEVEHVPISEDVMAPTLNSSLIYLTIDPNMTSLGVVAMIEVGRITGDKYDLLNIPTRGALTEKGKGAPYVTCQNATEDTRVILFRTADATQVWEDEGCIIVEGTNATQLVKAADRFTYQLMGVIV